MNSPVASWIFELALHQLWIGAAIAALLWGLVRVRESAWSAESRYWLWSGALVVMALLPLFMLIPRAEWRAVEALEIPLRLSSDSVAAMVTEQRVATPSSMPAQTHVWPIAGVFVAVWVLGAVWRLSAIMRGLRTLNRWRHAASLLPPERFGDLLHRPADAEIRESADVTTPMVVGVLRPCVLLPVGFAEKLDRAHLALVLSHEVAHVRRGDPLHMLVQRLITALYFYNPAIHWVARQIDRERECSCDDRVIRHSHDSEAYASSLIAVARHVAGMPAPAEAVGAVGRTSQLKVRIERLLERSANPDVRPSWFAVGSTTSAILAAAVFLSPSIPLAQTAASAEPLGAPAKPATAGTASSVAGGATGRVLVEAARSGDLEAARDLVLAGADVNFAVPGDGTALIVAARRGNPELVDLLIDNGADVNQAVRGDGNPLIGASARGDLDIVTRLIERGANVNAYVPDDETPLINAARRGQLDVVNYLVSKGADVNLAVPEGLSQFSKLRSPLSEARKHGQQRVVARLEELGATR
jgi:bla regulator protein BlaR1